MENVCRGREFTWSRDWNIINPLKITIISAYVLFEQHQHILMIFFKKHSNVVHVLISLSKHINLYILCIM